MKLTETARKDLKVGDRIIIFIKNNPLEGIVERNDSSTGIMCKYPNGENGYFGIEPSGFNGSVEFEKVG